MASTSSLQSSKRCDWRYVVVTDLAKLIPIGFFASLGAPILYGGSVIAMTVITGREVDIPLIATILVTAFMFSFLATELLVLLTIGIARLLHLRAFNVLSLSIVYVTSLTLLIVVTVGIKQALAFFVLALANASIFVALSRMRDSRIKDE